MENRHWYEAEALMADSTSRHHAILGASEEIEQRIRNRYPDAVAILVREETRTEARRRSTPRKSPRRI
ncbi:MAG: hypothetical protein WKF28_03575 [Rubrobacteraceae bacterium]